MFASNQFRQQFPILATQCDNQPLVYVDNGATTQKPQQVIDATSTYYQQANANVHRASHYLSAKATTAFEAVRAQVKQFIHADNEKEIIWTTGTTESLNIIAQCYALPRLRPGDEIVISTAEHHANIVPWQHVAEITGAKLVILPLDEQGRICLEAANDLITERCKIISVNHISNVLGKVNPIEALIAMAKSVGAISVIDGAQAIAHFNVDVQNLGCDFYVFSAHKMFGPNGVGVLYGKQGLLEAMPPYQFGGEMIKTVSFDSTTYNDLPHKFEAGTPNISGVVGLGATISFLQSELCTGIAEYEHQLTHYAYQKLKEINYIDLLVSGCPDIPLFTIKLKEGHSQDLAAFLDSKGIAVRAGHHCAMPLMAHFNLDGAVRISLAAYNTFDEIDYVIAQLSAFFTKEEAVDPIGINTAPADMTGFLSIDEVIDRFENAKSWDLRHRQIMLLAKELPRLPRAQRSDEDLISGCESKAWLRYDFNAISNILTFTTDSDAKVIRGLMVIILSAFQGKTAQQIIDFDINEYFEHLGLMQHLSPSRGNGVTAIVERIISLANQHR